jgi:hypothetical protein
MNSTEDEFRPRTFGFEFITKARMKLRPRVHLIALVGVAIVLTFCLTSCTTVCEDCGGGPPDLNARISYTNRTPEFVRMTIENSAGDNLPIPIALGTYESYEFFDTQFNFGSTHRVRIRFGTTSKSCLTFEGQIRDTLVDPRSPSSYSKIGYFGTYSYTFTDSLLHRAGPCP